MSKKHYNYISLDAINNIADDDVVFVREIVGELLREIPHTLKSLQSAVAVNNHKDIVFTAHKLKGTFGFIGAVTLQNIMEDIQQHPSETERVLQNMNSVDQLMPLVAAELDDLVSGLA